jgi:hypothetical protein
MALRSTTFAAQRDRTRDRRRRLKTAQTRLGYSDPRLTIAVCAQATTEADRAAADALQARFVRGARDIRGMEFPGRGTAGA